MWLVGVLRLMVGVAGGRVEAGGKHVVGVFGGHVETGGGCVETSGGCGWQAC